MTGFLCLIISKKVNFHLVFPNLKLGINVTNEELISTSEYQYCQKGYLLGRIVVGCALHYHRLDLVLFGSIHSRDIMIDTFSWLVLWRSFGRALSLLPGLLVLIAYRNSSNNQARVLGDEALLVDILFLCLSI